MLSIATPNTNSKSSFYWSVCWENIMLINKKELSWKLGLIGKFWFETYMKYLVMLILPNLSLKKSKQTFVLKSKKLLQFLQCSTLWIITAKTRLILAPVSKKQRKQRTACSKYGTNGNLRHAVSWYLHSPVSKYPCFHSVIEKLERHRGMSNIYS